MKIQTTSKELKNRFSKILTCSYCSMQSLLYGVEPVYYNAGVYGWNYDAYYEHGVLIVTGYRPFNATRPDYDTLREYEAKAEEIVRDWGIEYADKVEQVARLRAEYLEKAFA